MDIVKDFKTNDLLFKPSGAADGVAVASAGGASLGGASAGFVSAPSAGFSPFIIANQIMFKWIDSNVTHGFII